MAKKNPSWDLLPKIARQKINEKFPTKEKAILDEFKRIGRPLIDGNLISSSWDLIALAQHFGLSTRLLDWTSNPLVALWFAFAEQDLSVNERSVWALKLDESDLADTENGTPFDQGKTKAFKPNHISRRITAQNGWFTTHKFFGIGK